MVLLSTAQVVNLLNGPTQEVLLAGQLDLESRMGLGVGGSESVVVRRSLWRKMYHPKSTLWPTLVTGTQLYVSLRNCWLVESGAPPQLSWRKATLATQNQKCP